MILTQEELSEVMEAADFTYTPTVFARALEAKLLAKLCTMDMPEPTHHTTAKGALIGYFTADQLRTVAAAARLKALEEAAVVCDEVAETISSLSVLGATRCGIAIRALKGTTP